MDGEHHFNEITFADVFVADADVLGEIGDGWHQVTAELSFERSGPERILSTAPLLLGLLQALSRQAAEHDVDDRTAAAVGDLVARLISLRQLSVSVARALSAGESAANQAALVKDLGTRFEQESVDLAADLMDYVATRGQPAAVVGGRAAALADVHAARWHQRGVARRHRARNGVCDDAMILLAGCSPPTPMTTSATCAAWSTTSAVAPPKPASVSVACRRCSTRPRGATSKRPA